MARPKSVMVTAKNNLMQGFNFILYLNHFTYGFQSIDGLRIESTPDYFSEGGVNDHAVLTFGPNTNQFTLTLRRGMVLRHPSILTNAMRAAVGHIPDQVRRQAAMLAVSAVSPQDALESGPALGFIEVYSRDEKLEAAYSFLSLGVISWDGGELNASNSEILAETITLAHTGLTRLPIVAKPSLFTALKNYSEDADVAESARAAERRVREEERKKKIEEYRQQTEQSQKELQDKKNKLEQDILKYQQQLDEINKQLANATT